MAYMTAIIFDSSEFTHNTVQQIIDRLECMKLIYSGSYRNHISFHLRSLRGLNYSISMANNRPNEDGDMTSVCVSLHAPDGRSIMNKAFPLNEDGKLAYQHVKVIEDAMNKYDSGTFECAICGKDDRRFGEGIGAVPNGLVCAKCNADPEVQERTYHMFVEASR